jgi:hypothetical protein
LPLQVGKAASSHVRARGIQVSSTSVPNPETCQRSLHSPVRRCHLSERGAGRGERSKLSRGLQCHPRGHPHSRRAKRSNLGRERHHARDVWVLSFRSTEAVRSGPQRRTGGVRPGASRGADSARRH